MNAHGIGFTIEDSGANVVAYLQSHDGTTQSESSTVQIGTSTNQGASRFRLIYDLTGTPTLYLYRNGSLIASKTTNLPAT